MERCCGRNELTLNAYSANPSSYPSVIVAGRGLNNGCYSHFFYGHHLWLISPQSF